MCADWEGRHRRTTATPSGGSGLMRIVRVSVDNFRCFERFALDLSGESRFLIGENAVGKSSLITAIARAVGRERGFQRTDFLDTNRAIDIQVTFTGLDGGDLGVFAEAADFGAVPSLTVGVMAVWDSNMEETDVTHGYPTKAWKPSNRSEREAIDVYWISATRDPSRLLQFGARRGLLADVLSQVDLAAAISTAIENIKAASDALASTGDLQSIMRNAGAELGNLLPAVGSQPFGIDSAVSTELEVMRQLQIMLHYGIKNLPLPNQSSGLAQLTMFAFCLLSIKHQTGSVLLIDEPELSLHPQTQRALLTALNAVPNQYIVATHSPVLLDSADPRKISRLHRDNAEIKEARAIGISDAEAAQLARFTTPQNAEAFFARKAILVEGASDKYALQALAARKGRNLNADGVSIVVMEGAGGIDTFLALLGPKGLRVDLAGLCDAAEEAKWSKALKAHGLAVKQDRAEMARIGFFICDNDLEDVLITAVGEKATTQIIDGKGEKKTFGTFSRQPAQIGKSTHELLHDFLHTRGRQVTYAPLLVDHINLGTVPTSLEGVIDAV
jgi:predicted ATPase